MTTEPKPSFFARFTPPETAPSWGLGAVFLTIAMLFVGVIVASAAVGTWLGNRPSALLIAWVFGGLFGIALVLQTRRSPAERTALRLTTSSANPFLLAAAMVAVAMALDLLSLGVTGHFLPHAELLPLVSNPDALGWLFAAVLLLAVQPIAEGMVFHGVAFPALRAAIGAWGGILATAILYAAFHLIIYTPTYSGIYIEGTRETAFWYGFILPLLEGFILTLTRSRTGSTRAAIIAHAAFGAFALIKLIAITT